MLVRAGHAAGPGAEGRAPSRRRPRCRRAQGLAWHCCHTLLRCYSRLACPGVSTKHLPCGAMHCVINTDPQLRHTATPQTPGLSCPAPVLALDKYGGGLPLQDALQPGPEPAVQHAEALLCSVGKAGSAFGNAVRPLAQSNNKLVPVGAAGRGVSGGRGCGLCRGSCRCNAASAG